MMLKIGALIAGVLVAITGCQDGYPIPATRCDEWCDATQALCGPYDPATCVAECERAQLSRDSCKAQFDLALECWKKSKNEIRCEYPPYFPCTVESRNLSICTSADPVLASGFSSAPEPAPSE